MCGFLPICIYAGDVGREVDCADRPVCHSRTTLVSLLRVSRTSCSARIGHRLRFRDCASAGDQFRGGCVASNPPSDVLACCRRGRPWADGGAVDGGARLGFRFGLGGRCGIRMTTCRTSRSCLRSCQAESSSVAHSRGASHRAPFLSRCPVLGRDDRCQFWAGFENELRELTGRC